MNLGSHNNIVDFSKHRGGFEKGHHKSHFADSVEYANSLISDKQLLLGMMAQEAEKTLIAENLQPDHFILSDAYFSDFLSTRLNLDHPEDGAYVELVFHNVLPEQILAVCTFAVPEKPGEIHLSDKLYRLRHYSDGNRDWESYSFDAKTWVSGAGDDVFDLSVLLAEHERFIRQERDGGYANRSDFKSNATDDT